MKFPPFFVLATLACTMSFTGCHWKKDKGEMKTGRHVYETRKYARDIQGEEAKERGHMKRHEIKDKARSMKNKVERKMCNMCGSKTKEGKCVVCGK